MFLDAVKFNFILVQIISLIKNAGDNFTKDYLSAFSHIIHMGFITLSIYIVSVYTDWHDKYFFSMYFCMALTMVRDITYMQMCVVAEEEYNQFQSTVIVYSTIFPGKFKFYLAYVLIR